jgi:hypothetical protein
MASEWFRAMCPRTSVVLWILPDDGAKTLLRVNVAIERPQKSADNIKSTRFVFILSYSLIYFMVVEIPGVLKHQIAPKNWGGQGARVASLPQIHVTECTKRHQGLVHRFQSGPNQV